MGFEDLERERDDDGGWVRVWCFGVERSKLIFVGEMLFWVGAREHGSWILGTRECIFRCKRRPDMSGLGR